MRRAVARCVTLGLALALTAPLIANADPIQVGGFLESTSDGGDFPNVRETVADFLFYFPAFSPRSGASFAISGLALETSAPHQSQGGLQLIRQPASPGHVDLSLRATWTQGSMNIYDDFDGHPAGPFYTTQGDFRLMAGAAVVEPGTGYFSAPVVFSGTLVVLDRLTGARLFHWNLAGVGRGTASFGADGSFGYFYTVAPIPEPATWLLLGGGLGLAWKARRARRA